MCAAGHPEWFGIIGLNPVILRRGAVLGEG
jgi:hypothetical protein